MKTLRFLGFVFSLFLLNLLFGCSCFSTDRVEDAQNIITVLNNTNVLIDVEFASKIVVKDLPVGGTSTFGTSDGYGGGQMFLIAKGHTASGEYIGSSVYHFYMPYCGYNYGYYGYYG